MTSLASAFDGADAAPLPAVGAYATPHVGRYEDNVADEADRRFAYEHGRQLLYARSPPHHNMQHPVMSSQEAFRELQPGAYGDAAERQVAASCSTCQRDMCCNGSDVFCSACNRQTLERHAADPIPSLFQ